MISIKVWILTVSIMLVLIYTGFVYAGTFTMTSSGGSSDWTLTSGGTGNVTFTGTVGEAAGSILLESGDIILLESGDQILLGG